MGAQASQLAERYETESTTKLTPTQLKVLRGVRSGQLNKQIAYDLGIAEATVKAHMTALMRKLNVRNRTQVAVVAQELDRAGDARHGQTRVFEIADRRVARRKPSSTVHVPAPMKSFPTKEGPMTVLKSTGILFATAAAFVVASAPVAAKPVHHRSHKVCKVEHFHGHAKRVCRWVR